MSAAIQRKLAQAHQCLANGKVPDAIRLCAEVLERAPRNPDALWLLATARLMEGRADLAVPLLERAAAAVPDRGSVLESLGLAYLMAGNYAAAERVLRNALALPGAPPSVRMRLGLALMHQGDHSAAIGELGRTVTLDGANPEAHLALGQAYAGAGEWDRAAQTFERVLALDPDRTEALYNLGVVHVRRGHHERARGAFERVLARDPASLDARERLAATLLTVRRYGEAITHLREIVAGRPADVEARLALANACFQQGLLDEAQEQAQDALARDPAAAPAYSVLSRVHYIRAELDQATAILERGYERTGARPLLGQWVHLAHRLCDWEKWGRAWALMAPQIDTASDLGSPFSLLHEMTGAEQQLSYTQRWAAGRFANAGPEPLPARPDRAGRRLRLGYFSSDFHEHAVAHLIVEVLEQHDRERFEIYVYSYGPDDGSEMRARIVGSVEHFVDIAWEPDDAVVARMRDDALDVLVDLRGYTVGDRLEIMAQRPAPVQVTWLGYPGTTGARFMDYLIADGVIIPEGFERFYSEKIVRMPHCYQPNDSRRSIGVSSSRADYGLPEDGFVFCCFNQAVKITPEIFERWMSLLRKVPGSVMWILEDNRWAGVNLKRYAQVQGVDPARIVMAGRMSNTQHLARLQCADLALDTFPYTSHTTANDALWMGCPLVALRGETFAARVSASVLSSRNLPDLVTDTLDQYEALAYRLATDADYMSQIRARLDAARDGASRFDARTFARDLERIYLQISR